MANLYITEYKSIGKSAGVVQAPTGVPIAEQKIAFTTSTQSATFQNSTTLIRVNTDGECHLAFGTNPTATDSNMRLIADQTEYFAIPKNGNLKVAAVTA